MERSDPQPSKLEALHGSIEQALGHTISENQLRAMTVVFKIYFIAREKAASTSSSQTLRARCMEEKHEPR